MVDGPLQVVLRLDDPLGVVDLGKVLPPLCLLVLLCRHRVVRVLGLDGAAGKLNETLKAFTLTTDVSAWGGRVNFVLKKMTEFNWGGGVPPNVVQY